MSFATLYLATSMYPLQYYDSLFPQHFHLTAHALPFPCQCCHHFRRQHHNLSKAKICAMIAKLLSAFASERRQQQLAGIPHKGFAIRCNGE